MMANPKLNNDPELLKTKTRDDEVEELKQKKRKARP